MSLQEQLYAYCKSDAYPLHMPGHKRRLGSLPDPFCIDITEIDGFDNLHHAEGILAKAQERAAQLYGAQQTFYLVNGSTGGILSAVSACVPEGGTILMARNCHKAVYHAAELRGLKTIYLYPEVSDTASFLNGSIDPKQVEDVLCRHPEIDAVLITSPTYDGILSDICEIAQAAHRHQVPLIVDEAHGAHFGFHPYFPENALKKGADIVINSLHKTLPSLTQTALLHVQGDLVNMDMLCRYLGIYQTSSPSYVFMAGMERCLALLAEEGHQLFEEFAVRLERFYQETSMLRNIRVLDFRRGHTSDFDTDPSKLVIAGPISGLEIAAILRGRFHLEVEMAEESYALALMSIADDDKGFARLTDALHRMDAEFDDVLHTGVAQNYPCRIYPEQFCTIAQAVAHMHCGKNSQKGGTQQLPLVKSIGKVSLEYAYIYPPGIPLLVPGEVISEELIRLLERYRVAGHSIQGMSDHSGETIRCFC